METRLAALFPLGLIILVESGLDLRFLIESKAPCLLTIALVVVNYFNECVYLRLGLSLVVELNVYDIAFQNQSWYVFVLFQ